MTKTQTVEVPGQKKPFSKPKNFWLFVLLGLFVCYFFFIFVLIGELTATLQQRPVEGWVFYMKIAFAISLVIEAIISIAIPIAGAFGEKNYQIDQNQYEVMQSPIYLNDVDSEAIVLKVLKAQRHKIALNSIQRMFLNQVELFKQIMTKERNNLQSIDFDELTMFESLDSKAVEIENLRFNIKEEYFKIQELLIEDQLSLLWRGLNAPLYEKLRSSDEFSKRFEKWAMERMMKKKTEQDSSVTSNQDNNQDGIEKAEELGKEKDTKPKKSTAKKSKEEIKTETEEELPLDPLKKWAKTTEKLLKENKLPPYDESAVMSSANKGDLLKLYEIFHNFRILVWNALISHLKLEYRIELAKMEDYSTYYIILPKPQIIAKNWDAFTEDEHAKHGSRAIFITCPGDWKTAFEFPRRSLYDWERERNIYFDAALPTFSIIENIYEDTPWLMTMSCNNFQKSNYNVGMHVSQIRDLRDDILRWMSYHAIENNKPLMKQVERLKTANDKLSYDMDRLKGANMEKWIDEGYFPQFFLKRSLSPPMNVSHYWIFYVISIVVIIIVFLAILFGSGAVG